MKTYMNLDTWEIWTEEEIQRSYNDLRGEIAHADFKEYMEHLLSLGKQRISGLAEVTGYVVRDREAGNPIERFATMEDAEAALRSYEESDKKDGIYEQDFYEVAPVID